MNTVYLARLTLLMYFMKCYAMSFAIFWHNRLTTCVDDPQLSGQ